MSSHRRPRPQWMRNHAGPMSYADACAAGVPFDRYTGEGNRSYVGFESTMFFTVTHSAAVVCLVPTFGWFG